MRLLLSLMAILLVFMTKEASAEFLLQTEAKSFKPSCVMMKFSNTTKYKELDVESTLADFVLEKLLASKLFDFKEMQPLDDNIESLVYDENRRNRERINIASKSGKLDALFDDSKPASIGEAEKGEIISPQTVSKIGKEHDADYLIHGTIANLSSEVRTDGFLIFSSQTADISAVGELRIISSATGEVIWLKREVGSGSQSSTMGFGSAKLNSNLYGRAMNDVAQKLADALIEDVKAHKIFY